MLLKELLKVLPNSQKCKVIFYDNEELFEVKGTTTYLVYNYEYLLDREVLTAYTRSENSFINICL